MSKRILSVISKEVHAKAMRATYGSRQLHPGPDCAYCRNSLCADRVFICSLGKPANAVGCAEFRDTRNNTPRPDFP